MKKSLSFLMILLCAQSASYASYRAAGESAQHFIARTFNTHEADEITLSLSASEFVRIKTNGLQIAEDKFKDDLLANSAHLTREKLEQADIHVARKRNNNACLVLFLIEKSQSSLLINVPR